ncbi:cysteine desulfurase NifS [Calorimonas adulescens]|uniref:Cysteine desulfurase n=1 Tax=Calorimonas adulescens TaxID=2606906 RepID=A0A5D8QG19_9THEO|nr:cysteine desulfurase NifS [Calorimonas adulescens]TZE83495.1 cysteine desulfurase NifS [Calorimonas adulescens]
MIYLDNAATTKVRPEVLKEMLPYYEEYYGNPSSIYYFSASSRDAIDKARQRTARAIKARPSEIFFTSGGSEADNWAIKGTALALRENGNHIITTSIEHHAVLNAAHFLEEMGYRVTYLPVDKYGMINPDDVKNAITKDTILISVMYANNEVGTIEPIKEIGRIARENGIYFHTDAVQAVGHIPTDVEELMVDLLSMSAHKFYGPKGVGALYIREGTKIFPLIHGGSQERNRRAGTENVPGIVGMGKAIELAAEEIEGEYKRVSNMRDTLIDRIISSLPDIRLNGHPESRLPNIINIGVNGVSSDTLLLNLDMAGIYVSGGSACTAGSLDPSHVLLAMGQTKEEAKTSIRFSLGRYNRIDEIDEVVEKFTELVTRLRKN